MAAFMLEQDEGGQKAGASGLLCPGVNVAVTQCSWQVADLCQRHGGLAHSDASWTCPAVSLRRGDPGAAGEEPCPLCPLSSGSGNQLQTLHGLRGPLVPK